MGTQVSIAFWARIVTPPVAFNESGISFVYFDGVSLYSLSLVHANGGTWGLTIDSGGTLTVATSANWDFLVATYDYSTGQIGLSLNGAAKATQIPSGPIDLSTYTQGRVVIGTGANDTHVVQFDEVALYPSVLSDAEISYLYNSGTGRTYPP